MQSPELEAPLEGLIIGKTLDQMTDDEIRQAIIERQEKRVSSQAMQAHIRASVKPVSPPKLDAFSEF